MRAGRLIGIVAGMLMSAGASAQSFETSNLPIVVIDVGQNIPNSAKVTAHMGVIDNGPGTRNSLADPFNGYDGAIGIEIRGSSSASFPKKSYAVETRDATGANLNVPLLGMPEENDWVFYGPYSDKSFLRNALIMHLSRAIGRYASRTRFVEVVIDGDYRGVYVVMERIKRDGDRVDIERMDPVDTAEPEVTGGYIVKVDKTDGEEVDGWYSAFGPYEGSSKRVLYQYHYPRPDDIAPEQEVYIQQAMYTFESRMASAAWDDPVFGYSRYLDPDAAVDFILLVELGKNIDGYRLSTYMHRDRERAGEPPSRFVMGPIWDFNLAFGNANYYRGEYPTGFFIEDYDLNDYFPVPFWFRKLWDESAFHSMVRARWTQLRAGAFSNEAIMGYINDSAEVLREAEARDAARWGNLGVYVWPNPVVPSTWDGELAYLRNWTTARLMWLDSELLSGVGTEAGEQPTGGLALVTYPNPARESAVVETSGPAGTRVRLAVFDLLGRLVVDESRVLDGAAATLRLDTGRMAPGVYLVRAVTAEGAAVSRSLVVTP